MDKKLQYKKTKKPREKYNSSYLFLQDENRNTPVNYNMPYIDSLKTLLAGVPVSGQRNFKNKTKPPVEYSIRPPLDNSNGRSTNRDYGNSDINTNKVSYREEGPFYTDYFKDEVSLIRVLKDPENSDDILFETDMFLIQNITYQRTDGAQVVVNNMKDFVIFHGARSPIYNVSLILPNGPVANWFKTFEQNYDNYFMGSVVSSRDQVVQFLFEDIVLSGFILGLSTSTSASIPRSVSVNFRFFVHNRDITTSVSTETIANAKTDVGGSKTITSYFRDLYNEVLNMDSIGLSPNTILNSIDRLMTERINLAVAQGVEQIDSVINSLSIAGYGLPSTQITPDPNVVIANGITSVIEDTTGNTVKQKETPKESFVLEGKIKEGSTYKTKKYAITSIGYDGYSVYPLGTDEQEQIFKFIVSGVEVSPNAHYKKQYITDDEYAQLPHTIMTDGPEVPKMYYITDNEKQDVKGLVIASEIKSSKPMEEESAHTEGVEEPTKDLTIQSVSDESKHQHREEFNNNISLLTTSSIRNSSSYIKGLTWQVPCTIAVPAEEYTPTMSEEVMSIESNAPNYTILPSHLEVTPKVESKPDSIVYTENGNKDFNIIDETVIVYSGVTPVVSNFETKIIKSGE